MRGGYHEIGIHFALHKPASWRDLNTMRTKLRNKLIQEWGLKIIF